MLNTRSAPLNLTEGTDQLSTLYKHTEESPEEYEKNLVSGP